MTEGITRRKSRTIQVGSVAIGGQAPVTVQSMCNTDTRDTEATLSQIQKLFAAGCEIIRLAVPDEESVKSLKKIAAESPLPVIADIHFDYRLALGAIAAGIQGLRLNPGNIGGRERVKAVVDAARERQLPIRIGVNAGSLEKGLYDKYGGVTSEALVESALNHVRLLEDLDYPWIKISLKASHIPLMLRAYQLLAEQVDYPLHIGVTEAGTVRSGMVKSAVGIGALLAQGIGDTLRVSITGDPVHEVWAGWEILKSLGLRKRGPEIISCPTCGRTKVNLIQVAEQVEQALQYEKKHIRVAVMGCAVNGPGEAREADIGIAGGQGCGIIFKKGAVIGKVPEEKMVEALLDEIRKMEAEE